MPNPWVSLRHYQLILVNKAVNEKEQLEKGLEEEEKKSSSRLSNKRQFFSQIFGNNIYKIKTSVPAFSTNVRETVEDEFKALVITLQ
jgi:hypothetical protein